MGRKCRHRRCVGRLWSQPYPRWYHSVEGQPRQRLRYWVDAIVCADCQAWLPIGPANDDPEAVQIELLAAYLVRPDGFISVAHKDHHDREEFDENYNYSFHDDCIGCWAELLRDDIVDHEHRDAKRGSR